ncbi:hypothetical protein ACWEF9_09125 [Streptomyces sp. NPDC004980]
MKPFRIASVTTAAALVLAASAWTAYSYLSPTGRTEFEAVTLHNPDDDQQVATAARDVFRATVQRHTGTRTIQDIPSEIYEVRVTHTYKGNLTGTVLVTQIPDDPPLRSGHAYIFPTVPWDNTGQEHAVLAETVPRPADHPHQPATTTVGAAHGTVDQHWTWVTTHPAAGINSHP